MDHYQEVNKFCKYWLTNPKIKQLFKTYEFVKYLYIFKRYRLYLSFKFDKYSGIIING